MPLYDHFRSPVNDKHHWSELHGWWPAEIARQLFDLLPPGYQVAPKVNLSSPFEVDAATYDDDERASAQPNQPSDSGAATLTASALTLTVPTDLSEFDEYEVLVYDVERERTLVAAIEIVSPSNKDRPESRVQFLNKVVSLLRQDVCVSVVDLVTIRQANLYVELLARLGHTDTRLGDPPPSLYAVTFRKRKPIKPKHRGLLDSWFYPMMIDQPLPTIPIWLGPDLHIELPHEASYREVCRLLRIA